MHAYTGRAIGTPTGLALIAVALLMLSSVGCTEISTWATLTAPAAARSTPQPTAAARPPTLPPPTAIAPLPTFPLHAGTSQPLTAKQPKVTVTLDPKESLHVLTDWALRPSERQTSRVKGVAYGRYEPGDIVFEWWLYNYPSADSMRWNARLDACTILMGIVRGPLDYTSAVLHGYLRSEQKGRNNDEGLLVVSLIYDRPTAENIDFDNNHYLCPDKIYELADRSSIAVDFR